jgi:hypothetical protein
MGNNITCPENFVCLVLLVIQAFVAVRFKAFVALAEDDCLLKFMPCCLVDRYQGFRGIHCLHLQGKNDNLIMERVLCI